ncbi:MAG: hypothetical protein HWN67_17375 [Candidatus Helarchaeota archaeon]|nr:hypothetical protein [Candidatus Helarchaeota archaeon]
MPIKLFLIIQFLWVFTLKVKLNELFQKIIHLIPIYSKKFYISLEGSRTFLQLAIIEAIKLNPELNLSQNENGFLVGDETKIQTLINEIEKWDENEFDLEDFEVISYCKNIR